MLPGQNIPMDSLYTGIVLATWLFNINTTCVETLNHNCQGIPAELEDISEQKEF